MQGGCLCGALRFRVAAPLGPATHCHCSRCRKAHGTAYATYAAAPEGALERHGAPARFATPGGYSRAFCPRCGSVAPYAAGDEEWVPLGALDGEPGLRPVAHIFVGSKAPWYEPAGSLPRFAAYPPGVAARPLADAPAAEAAPDRMRGGCLCGGVAFEIAGPLALARYCHCGRCRKARAAAFASNGFVAEDALVFTRGAEQVVTYKVPDALRFAQSFCGRCGGKLPRVDRERKAAVVPLGALDAAPGVRPDSHIFVGSKAAWDEIEDALPQHVEYAP